MINIFLSINRMSFKSKCESTSCDLNCDVNFTSQQLEDIKKFFNSIKDNQEVKREFYLSKIKKKTVGLKNVYSYSLDAIICCRHFFFKALDLKQSETRVISKIFDEVPDKQTYDNHIHSKEFNDKIENFVNIKYNPQNSHYNYIKCPNKKYISSSYGMTYMGLYKEFAKEMGFDPNTRLKESMDEFDDRCSFSYFYKFVKRKMNVGFEILSEDKCDICYTFNLHKNQPNVCDCKHCIKYESHRKDVVIARELYIQDKDLDSANTLIFSCDAEQVFFIPKMVNQECHWADRINVLNQTYCELKKNGLALCLLSNDSEVKRKAEDFISFMVHFIYNIKPTKDLVLWVDNCSSQNKNWLLYSQLIRIINDQSVKLNSLTIKYLEKGHTYNSCDSLHGIIGNKFKLHEIYSPSHLIEVIESLRINTKVKEISHKDIFSFPEEKIKKPFLLKNVKQYQVRKHQSTGFVKLLSHNTQFKEFTLIDTIATPIIPNYLTSIPKHRSPPGITQRRYDSLRKLYPSIPVEYQGFIDELKSKINVNENMPNN